MSYRTANLRVLSELGFRVAPSLPVARHSAETQLRAPEEILGRALALRAVCYWVAAEEEAVPSAKISARITSDNLDQYLADADREILNLSRSEAHQQYTNTIGWRLENIWPLAWVLGFDTQPTLQGMIDGSLIPKLMSYCPKGDVSAASFLITRQVRALSEVYALEDLFYCAHNAVRSAQLGEDTVPSGFDPIADGGAIHERRHALTWALSPGVGWDDTDLST